MRLKSIIVIGLSVLLVHCTTQPKHFSVIAHRGASGHLPEHTLASAALAHGFNVDFIEPDLVMTKDNQLIVLHDLTLDTTTDVATVFPNRKRNDGRYYAIDFTLKEIKGLQVYERFHKDTKKSIFPARYPSRASGFEVPSFEEFITLVQSLNRTRQKQIGIYPEIKKPEFHQQEGKDITKAVIHTLRKYGYEDSQDIFIQSFWPEALQRLKYEFKTKIPLVQLIGENEWQESSADYEKMLTKDGLIEIAKYAEAIGPTLDQVFRDNTLVKTAHEAGLLVHPYTHRLDQKPSNLSREQYIHKIKKLNVDGVFTDFANEF